MTRRKIENYLPPIKEDGINTEKDVTLSGDATLRLESTNNGGLNGTDSTNRIQLSSYQKAQKTADDGVTPAHFGEVVRIDLKHAQAKGIIAFREDYLGSGSPRTVAWLVAHGASNDDPNTWHNHFSIEIPDENGSLQTAMEWPFAPYNQANGYGHAVSGHYTRSTRKLIASNLGLIVENAAGNDRNIHFSSGAYGADADRRWSVQADSTAESGTNAGSNFRINRRSDSGAFVATPFFIRRSDGQVGINTTSPSQVLDVNGTTKTNSLIVASPTVPSTATSTGIKGQIAYDTDYIYLCVATNTWKRSALTSW